MPTNRRCVSLRAPHSCGDWSSDVPPTVTLQPAAGTRASLCRRKTCARTHTRAHTLLPDVSLTVIRQPVCQTRVGVFWWVTIFTPLWDISALKIFNKCVFYLLRGGTLVFTQLPLLTCVCGGIGAWHGTHSRLSSSSVSKVPGRTLSPPTGPRTVVLLHPSSWLKETGHTERRLFEINPLWRGSTDLCVMAKPERTCSTMREWEVSLWTFKPRQFEIQTVSSFIDNCFHVSCIQMLKYA